LCKLSFRPSAKANADGHRLLLAAQVKRTVQAVVSDFYGEILACVQAEAAFQEEFGSKSESKDSRQAELFGLPQQALD
jgi:hypothetical protein